MLFSRLLGRIGFVYYFICVKDNDGNNIQELIYLGICLIWNDAAVYGGRMGYKIWVRY